MVYYLPVVPQATVIFDAQRKALLLYEVFCFQLLTAFHFVRGSGSRGQYSKQCGACHETLLKIKKAYLLDGKIMPPPKKGKDMPLLVVVKYISIALPMHREFCPYVHHNVKGARVEMSSGVCLDSFTRIEPVGNHDSSLLLEHFGTAVVGHYLNKCHPRLSQIPVVEGGVAKLCNLLCLLYGICEAFCKVRKEVLQNVQVHSSCSNIFSFLNVPYSNECFVNLPFKPLTGIGIWCHVHLSSLLNCFFFFLC